MDRIAAEVRSTDRRYAFKDLVDNELLQGMFEKFSRATGFATGLASYPEQVMLITTGWQDICSRFHRTCRASDVKCRQSHQKLVSRLEDGDQLVFRNCENGLVDGATPVIVDGMHVASVFTGQILLEEPDIESFRKQGELYEYDVDAYLKALSEVPVVAEEELTNALDLLARMAAMLGEQGLSEWRRREAERARGKTAELTRVLADSAIDVIWALDMDLKFTYISPSVERMRGYTPDEAMQIPLDQSFTPASYEKVVRAITEEIARDGELGVPRDRSRKMELDSVKKGGGTIPVEVNASFLRDEAGQLDGIIGVTRDITERKKAELLQEVQRNILEAALDAKTVAGLAGRIHEEVNRLMDARNFFLALYDKHTDTFTFPYFVDEMDPGLVEADKPVKVSRGFTDYVRRTGEPLLIGASSVEELVSRGEMELIGRRSESWMGVPLFEGSEVMGVLAIQSYTDPEAYSEDDLKVLTYVSGHIGMAVKEARAETALQNSEEKYRTLVNNALMGVVIARSDPVRLAFANPAMRTIFGYDVDELLGMGPPELALLIWEGDRQRFFETFQRRISGESVPQQDEYRVVCKDGSTKWVASHSSLIEYLGEPATHTAFMDITQRKKAEEEREELQRQLLQAQRMESIGRLAGGVAHDFNNMLGVILGHVELMLRDKSVESPLRRGLEQIQVAGRRSADITRQLLAFSRKQTIAPEVLDLNHAIESTLTMLRRLIGEDLELSWHPGEDLWPVSMDPSQLDQILANLCVNARDAIDGVGSLIIETENVCVDEAYCADQVGVVPGDYVMLAVSDDGHGMDRETLEHLFEPFFTTKEVGKGTGLGLATVYGIVTQNGGFVNAYSEPGQGSTIKVYLPWVAANATAPIAASPRRVPPTATSRGGETVLVVEDEPALREMCEEMLVDMGYAVVVAGLPSEAIRLAREHDGDIDLLLTDTVMPEMNGRDLAHRVSTLHPKIKCLFMSGYTADVIAHRGVLAKGMHFIQKPFTQDGMAGKIREVLEGE